MTKFSGAAFGYPSKESSKNHQFLKTQATKMKFSGYVVDAWDYTSLA